MFGKVGPLEQDGVEFFWGSGDTLGNTFAGLVIEKLVPESRNFARNRARMDGGLGARLETSENFWNPIRVILQNGHQGKLGLDLCAFYVRSKGPQFPPSRTVFPGRWGPSGTYNLNIKQARAVLHWAVWLQSYKTWQWERDGELQPQGDSKSPRPAPLNHVLIGGAGSGKTTTLLVIDALLEFFLGPDAMSKSAPTNTASRLLRGGDTTHARYKLPRGGCLNSKGGILSQQVFRSLQKKRTTYVTQAIDEVGMLQPALLHQINMRTRQITGNTYE